MADDVKIASLRPAARAPGDSKAEDKIAAFYHRLAIPALAVAVALGCVAVVSADWSSWVSGAANQSTDDAVVSADVSTLSAQVSGTIRTIATQDYQRVSKGDLLAEIDNREYEAAVEVAGASLASANAAIENLANQIELQKAAVVAAEAQNASAHAQLTQSEQEFNRQSNLGGATSQQMLQQAQSAFLQAQASVRITAAAIEQQKAQLKVLNGQYPILRAQAGSAQGTLDSVRIREGYTRIYAPFDGVVGRKLVQVGDLVSAGSGILSLVPLPSIYVIANFKETQLAQMKPGSRAEITVDSFPGERLSGKISRLAPASGSIFALLPPDNATGNYTKVVQRVSVRIEVDPDQPLTQQLKPGMSVVVDVETPSKEQ
ncbi:HlyD family secretion protein [Rhizobium leguminosarum]|uniref:HlyD family secretion protein n=1 Tax=Rhizobium leguminosarum TaxID=384 RepID=A0A444I7M5_RHILE|nr:HlyD family secretion protein [Rhizobium leguminosarum]RWX34218.1 HlyD family secretion protein [Rhizobium leguminosarum]